MRIITSSIAAFIASRFKPVETHPAEPDLSVEIPRKMLALWQREAMLMAVTAPFLSLGALTAIYTIWNLIDFNPRLLEPGRLVVFFLVQLGLSVWFWLGGALVRSRIKRELLYRRQHGKWRWER
jgi:hypothetical protein